MNHSWAQRKDGKIIHYVYVEKGEALTQREIHTSI